MPTIANLLPSPADMTRVVLTLPSGSRTVDHGDSREDALLLAQLHAEEHYDRLYGDFVPEAGRRITPVTNADNTVQYGFEFFTAGRTRVAYEVRCR